jgi:hypothetical protein
MLTRYYDIVAHFMKLADQWASLKRWRLITTPVAIGELGITAMPYIANPVCTWYRTLESG